MKLSFTQKLAALASLSVLAVVAYAQISTTYVGGVGVTSLLDANGNVVFSAAATTSAVNRIAITNSATGVAPTLGSAGSDTNIGLQITPKGTGLIALNNGTDPTKQILVTTASATTGTATTLSAAQAANVTLNLPLNAGGIPTVYSCGATSGATTCANTATGNTAHVVIGVATLASNSAALTGFSPAFTSSSTWSCVANDVTTRANPVQMVPQSGSAATITNTTGASDVVNFLCAGY